MINTEKALEFDRIKEIWLGFALTDFAKREIEGIEPYLSEQELEVRMRETTQARRMIEGWGNPPLVSMEGIRQWICQAGKGDCLTPGQLEDIEMALVAVGRLKGYLAKGRQQEIPLAYYDENLNGLEDLKEAIHLHIRSGRVDDNASRLLRSLREDIGRTETGMREKADSVMRANKECMSDSFSTVRNGRLCVPVKKEFKFRINGSVIDKSSTGNTLFMEPASVGAMQEKLELLRIDEENEERRILYGLSAMAADKGEAMEQNIRMMEKLDFIFSRGRLSLEYDGVEPVFHRERRMVIKEGRHPLIDRKVCVPLSLEIGGGVRGIVITGPNTGGKTVAIKTAALVAMMGQCGLHVPCREATLSMSSNFLCDIGDGQNLSENLSTFSAHIANVLDILKRVNQDSLVVMDELGSGTDPAEGMGIAIAILEELKKSGAIFLVTTHYPEVKSYAERTDGVINARMTFDKESLQPLYQLVPGEAGESCALYIARKMGMPRNMLRTAVEAAYGKNMRPERAWGASVNEEMVRRETADGEMADRETAYGGMMAGMDFSGAEETLGRKKVPGIRRRKTGAKRQEAAEKFSVGDSVMVYPDRKIGIVCERANEKGVLRVQLADRKIWVNHKRVKLKVAAEELYPDDYDFSIVLDTVENRKMRHDMERKYVEHGEIVVEEGNKV